MDNFQRPCLLGTGLFMIPRYRGRYYGSVMLLAWLKRRLLFIAICPIALTFAALGKRYPNAGGTLFCSPSVWKIGNECRLFVCGVVPVGIPAAIALAGGFAQQLLPAPLDTPLGAQFFTYRSATDCGQSHRRGNLPAAYKPWLPCQSLPWWCFFVWKAEITVTII